MTQMTQTVRFDHCPPAPMHDPDLYKHDAICQPVAGWDACEAAIDDYRRNGYVAVADALTPAEVASALEGLTFLIDGGRPDFDGISFEHAVRDRLPSLTPEQRLDAVRKLMWFCKVEPRLDAIAHHPRLIRVLRTLLGGKEPKLIQDMALLKPPKIGREKPWHQDHAYFNLPIGTPVVGVWIALDEATIENGCLRVLHGGHHQGPQPHFKRRDWQMCDTDVPRNGVVACPLKPGGLLLFDGLIPHGTPHNSSPARRRAVQFHYAPVDAVEWAEEERLKIFGGEGRGVEC